MKTLKRINKIIAANINHLLEKTEDPEKMIKQLIREMDQSIVRLRMEVARAIASEKRLARKTQAARDAVETWQHNAERALHDGDDALARKAVARRLFEERALTAYAAQHEVALRASEAMKERLRTLEDKIQDARRRKETLIARKRRAEARNAISDATRQFADVSGHTDELLHAAEQDNEVPLEALEDQVLDLECDAEAREEVLDAGQTVEQQVARADEEAQVDRALAELRARITSREDHSDART